jgi:hypothetical protein
MTNCTIITETDDVFTRNEVTLLNHKFKAGSVHWTTLTECKLVFDIDGIDPLNYIQKGDVLTVVLSDDPATVGPHTDGQSPSDDSENVVSFDTQVKRIRGSGAVVTRTNDSVQAIEQVLDD